MKCPYCGDKIQIDNKAIECPLCRASFDLSTRNRIIAEACVSSTITNADKNIIKDLLTSNRRADARYYIRKIRGRGDALIETHILRILEGEFNLYREDSQTYNTEDGCSNTGLILCIACRHQISKKAETCPHCGNPTGVHVCPKCNSTNTSVITGTSKAASIFLWGAFAANKVVSKYECKDCGHRF